MHSVVNINDIHWWSFINWSIRNKLMQNLVRFPQKWANNRSPLNTSKINKQTVLIAWIEVVLNFNATINNRSCFESPFYAISVTIEFSHFIMLHSIKKTFLSYIDSPKSGLNLKKVQSKCKYLKQMVAENVFYKFF